MLRLPDFIYSLDCLPYFTTNEQIQINRQIIAARLFYLLRRKKKVNRVCIARECNTNAYHINRLENGEVPILDSHIKMFNILNIDKNEFDKIVDHYLYTQERYSALDKKWFGQTDIDIHRFVYEHHRNFFLF